MLAIHSSYSASTRFNIGLQPKLPSNVEALDQSPLVSPTKAPDAQVSLREKTAHTDYGPKPRGVQAYQAVQAASPQNPYAATILNFIGAQLARDQANGDGLDQLQSRLEAGLAGFQNGYGEASAQLDASGLLTDDVKAAIGQTQEQVLAGIAKLAQAYGLAVPEGVAPKIQEPVVGAPPVAGDARAPAIAPPLPMQRMQSLQRLQSSLIAQLPSLLTLGKGMEDSWQHNTLARGQGRDFSFILKTRDGDEVTISASSRAAQVAGSTASGFGVSQQESGSFDLAVDGDLDEGELRAVSDLLDRVSGLSDTFFNGNVEEAFNQALGMGFDSNEISSYALQMTRVDVQKVQSAYADPNADKPEGSALSRWDALGGFVKQLNEAKNIAANSGFQLELLASLTEQYSAQAYGQNDKQERFGSFVGRLLRA